MAEGFARKRFREEGIDAEVKSAGTIGLDGIIPSPEALEVLREEGVGPEDLESTAITEKLIEWADIILVMDQSHMMNIISVVPDAQGKVFYLGGFGKNSESFPIPDPVGRPIAYYRKTFDLIKDSVEELVKWLKN